MKPKRTNRQIQIRKRVKELQKTIELADFYAFMLTFSVQQEIVDDQTIRCVLSCISNECHAGKCLVYVACPMKSLRICILN